MSTKTEQLAAIRAFMADDTAPVQVVDTWTDDHIPCAKLLVGGMEVDWWWCGPETIAAATYASSSPVARADLIKAMQESLEPEIIDDIRGGKHERKQP